MQAVVWTAYGPAGTLEVREVPKPSLRERDVLIEVGAATVSAADTEVRQLRLPGLIRFAFRLYAGILRPRRVTILGQDVAGIVVRTGPLVSRWRVGDEVIAATGIRMGGHAEYVRLDERGVMAAKPQNVSFEAAATLAVGGVEALQFIRQAAIQPGWSVLVNGAGGSIGTVAVQLAAAAGAAVTAVDRPEKHDLLRSIGARHVMDHASNVMDPARHRFDVIFDVIGSLPVSRCIEALQPGGALLVSYPQRQHGRRGRGLAERHGVSLVTSPAGDAAKDLAALCERVAEGEIVPVVDRVFAFEQAVDAHCYVESGMKRGSVVFSTYGTPSSEQAHRGDAAFNSSSWWIL